MNRVVARRFWLLWRADLAAGLLLVLFMVLAFEVPSLLIEGHL